MKKNTDVKKLILSKDTLRALDQDEDVKKAKGGRCINFSQCVSSCASCVEN